MPKITPNVRAYAMRHGIDIDELTGSGRSGFITNRDVDAAFQARFYKPGPNAAPNLPNPQPDFASSGVPQAREAVRHWRSLQEDDQYQSWLKNAVSPLMSRRRMMFTGEQEPFDQGNIDSAEQFFRSQGIGVQRKEVELFPRWGKESVLSINQNIRGRSTETYMAFGPTGGTYLANPDNLGGLRPILGSYDGEQYQSPVQRVAAWAKNNAASVIGHAQREKAEWVDMQRLEAQPGLDRLYRSGIQFAGEYDSERRGLMDRYNQQYGTDYQMFQGVGSAYRIGDYAGVVPTSDAGEMLVSKLKRLKLATGKISGASIGVGMDLQQDYEPFYVEGMSGPNKSTVFRAAYDLFGTQPEGASYANPYLSARKDITKTVMLPSGVTYNQESGALITADGTEFGAGSYFGRIRGYENENLTRLGGIRDFENMFGISGRSYNAILVNSMQPVMNEAGEFSGKVKLGLSGYVPDFADKYGTKSEPMAVQESYLPEDETGRRADFWYRLPDKKDLPAEAMRVLKAEMRDTETFRKGFIDYAFNKGVEVPELEYGVDGQTVLYDNRGPGPTTRKAALNRMLFADNEGAKVRGSALPLLKEFAVDRFMEGFQPIEKQNEVISSMQYDALKDAKFTHQGQEYNVLNDVTQNDNGTYTVGTFRDMRRFADVATNIRAEHTRDETLIKPGAMSVMAQYQPELFANAAQIAQTQLHKNSAYNIVASYRANYAPEMREQVSNVFGGIAKLQGDEINGIRQQILNENPDINGDQMMKAMLGRISETYGRQSLEVGGVVLPNARAIMGNLTMSKDQTLINNWARKAGEAISLAGENDPLSQEHLGNVLSSLMDPNDKDSLAKHANRQGVLEKAVGFNQRNVGGIARAIPDLGINQALMSMKHAMRVTGIEDRDQLREMAKSGSLGTIFRYPWSDPTDQFAKPEVSFYEDLPKDSPIRQKFLNPESNIYVSNEIMAQVHGDVDGDRVATLFNVLKAGGDRIVGNVMQAQSGSDVMGRTKRAFESEYYKYLEAMQERSGAFENLRPEAGMPMTSDELRQQFETEEGQARSHLGKVYNALLRQMGGSVNPTTEGMFGAEHPLSRLVADSMGDINSYGIQSFVDRSAKRDRPFENIMGKVYRNARGTFRQKGPRGSYEDVAAGPNAFYQKKMIEAAQIGGNLSGEGFEGDANAEYRAKLAPAVATSLINRNELSRLYTEGGEEAVSSRVNEMADALTEMRTTGNYDAGRLLPLTGASSFSEWGLGTDGLESMSAMAEYVTGGVQLSHFDNAERTTGTGTFQDSMGGASVAAGQAMLASRRFKTEVDKPEKGLEAMVGNQGGMSALRGWISSLFPGAGNPADAQEKARQLQSVAQNMGGVPINAGGGVPINLDLGGGVPIGDLQQTAASVGGGVPIPSDLNLPSDFVDNGKSAMSAMGGRTAYDAQGKEYDLNYKSERQKFYDQATGAVPAASNELPPTSGSDVQSAISAALGGMSGGGGSGGTGGSGGGGRGGGRGGSGGGGGSNNYYYNTSQPHISEKTLAEAAGALQHLNEMFKSTTEVVTELTDASSEHREELVQTYEQISKVANYARQMDSYAAKVGPEAVADTTDRKLFQTLFNPQAMAQMNDLTDQMGLPVAYARMQGVGQGGKGASAVAKTRYQDMPSLQDFEKEEPSSVERFADRMIQGQGFFRAHMAYNMLVEPAFNAAENYLERSAERGVTAYRGGALSYDDLMQGQYGTIRRRQAAIEAAQFNFGKNVYDAYGPLVDFAHGGSTSLLGTAAAIGAPALGAGIVGSTLFGSVATGGAAAVATAAYGLYNYADSNSRNYLAIGRAKREGEGDALGAVGQMFTNAEGMFGFASAWWQRRTGQMSDEEWERIKNAPEYATLLDTARTEGMGQRDFAAAAQGLGYSPGTSVPVWQQTYIEDMNKKYGIGEEQALSNLQFMQMLDPNVAMNDSLLSRMSEYSAAGLNVPDIVGRMSASQNRSPVDFAGTEASLRQFDLYELALTLREPGLSPEAAGARIDYAAQRNQPVNQWRAMAGRMLRSNEYGTFPTMFDDNGNRYMNGDDFFYRPELQKLEDEGDIARSQVQVSAGYYGSQTGQRYTEELRARLLSTDTIGANALIQGYQTSANMYMQATTFGASQAEATLLNQRIPFLTQEQQGVAQAIQSGNRLVISQQAAAMGRMDLRTMNTQTGQSIFYQDLDQEAINTLRSNDRYGYMSGVTDEQLQKGQAGLQNDIRLIQREEFRYQRGMQIQQNLMDLGSRYGGAGNMEILRNIGAQYGVQMDPRITRGYREMEDANIALNRMQQDWSMAQQGAQLNIAQRQFDTSGRQFQENFGLNYRQFQFNTGVQRQEMQLNREQQQLSQQYQREDLAYNRNQMNLNFSWQMEDYNRNIRYARGREKRDLMREKKRAVIRYSMQSGQQDKQETRLETSISYQEKEFELKREQFEQSIRFREEEFELQKKHFEENRQFERERMLLQKQNFQMQLQFLQEERRLQDERLLLDRFVQDTFTQMSLQMQQRAYEAQNSINTLSDALGGMGMVIQSVTAEIEVMRFQLAYQYATNNTNTIGTSGIGSTRGPQANAYADGGYTGDGGKHEVAGVVHKGEYVVPQNGTLVLKGDDSDTKLLEKMVQLLQVIADNPTSFQAVIEGTTTPTTPVYRQSQSRL